MRNDTSTNRGPATARPSARARLTPAALARLLQDEIGAGRYAVGSRMPTELELQRRYDASRYCVREALQALKDSGMVSARAGIGHTVLATEPAQDRYMHGSMTLDELVQSASTTLHVVKARDVVVDTDRAAQTGIAPGTQVIEVTALRSKIGAQAPVALLTMTLRSTHALMVRYMEGEKEPFHIVLERRFGVCIDEVQQRIVAVDADARSTSLLQAPARQPCLRIDRRFLDVRGEVIFASIGLYPSDRFSHDTAFKIRR